MASVDYQPQERRSQTQQWIGDLVRERQEMLVQYAGLAGLEPYTPDKPVRTQLRDFCQILVDYIAAGHFGLYRRISQGEERRQGVVELAGNLYARIAATTEIAVEFNDHYEDGNNNSLTNLPEHLSRLGEELASRIELEDQLIGKLLVR